jgi:hypothetical protein
VIVQRVPPIVATVAVVAAIAVIDRSPSDDAAQLTLAVMLVGSAALGAWAARRAWLVGIVTGSVVAASHLVSLLLDLPEPGIAVPPGSLGTLSLLVLVIPASIAAYAGAAARRLVAGGGAPPLA